MAQCPNHPHAAAVRQCFTCGNQYCPECFGDDRFTCRGCQTGQPAKGPQQGKADPDQGEYERQARIREADDVSRYVTNALIEGKKEPEIKKKLKDYGLPSARVDRIVADLHKQTRRNARRKGARFLIIGSVLLLAAYGLVRLLAMQSSSMPGAHYVFMSPGAVAVFIGILLLLFPDRYRR